MAKQVLIEVKSAEVKTKSGTSGRTGKAYTIHEQAGFAVIPEKAYPVEITFAVEGPASAYPPGLYEIGPGSYFVGNFGQLMLGRLQLLPAAKAQPQPAAVAAR